MNFRISFTIILLLANCTPKVIVKNLDKNVIPTFNDKAFVVVKPSQKFNNDSAKFVASVIIKDNGLMTGCDYPTIEKLAIDKARILGGNCLRINRHRYPDGSSLCHRIWGDVYVIEDAEKYEKKIEWSISRKLTKNNFLSDTTKRPFQAITVSYIYYSYSKVFSKTTVDVKTLFDCQKSYFKTSTQDDDVLNHEQLHFDISEIYARKFVSRIKKECLTYKDFLGAHQRIYDEVVDEWFKKQDEYDAETHYNPENQGKWNEWVSNELLISTAHSYKTFVLGRTKL